MDQKSKEYLDNFISTLSTKDHRLNYPIDSFYFYADEDNANLCADLVVRGEKRATASLYWEYEAGEEALPKIGQISVITNWKGDPQCIIEVTEAQITPFNKVDDKTI